MSITRIVRSAPSFPSSLLQSADPPEAIYLRGTWRNLPLVAVVGTRRASAYGAQAVAAIVPTLVEAGLGIISGLALGIDALAHAACLENGGYTVAVLGTGVDDGSVYPRANDRLARRILESGGALLSEYPPGTGARKEHFPKRNRIIASCALATLVIEASEKSGSLITAKLALEENREVMAVPGPIWSNVSKGTNALIKAGAGVCTGPEDVLNALAMERPQIATQARDALPLAADERDLLSLLDAPRHVDDLCRIGKKEAAAMTTALSLLEMKGLVTRLDGQIWTRATV